MFGEKACLGGRKVSLRAHGTARVVVFEAAV